MNNAIAAPLNCGTFDTEPTYIFKKPDFGGNFFQLKTNPIIRTISATSSGTINQADLQIIVNKMVYNYLWLPYFRQIELWRN
jgi:hypothetical protein